MNVLLTGAAGQLGRELRRHAPARANVMACDRTTLDLRDPQSVGHELAGFHPDIVINAAAYTRVDDAEADPTGAYAINADGAARLAEAASLQGARLIHVSTDFVFDGNLGRPYRPDDSTNPQCIYGESKRAGEEAVLSACGSHALVVRTSWLYAARGHNFVNSMLRLMQERDELGVVADQVGSPTWAAGLATAIWEMAERPDLSGVLHWSDAGVASWYDFAMAIQEEARARDLLDHCIPIRPLTTAEFPRPAKRPPSSILDNSETWAQLDTPPVHWRQALGRMLDETTETAHA